jgi:hypothetical protein
MRRIALLGLLVVAGCGLNTSPGDGEKVGQIVKLSRVGMIDKTWEGQIVRGGFQGASGVNGQAFEFTVEDEGLAKEVGALMEAQAEVKIRYRSEGIWSSFRSESGGHFLVSIERVTPNAPRAEK